LIDKFGQTDQITKMKHLAITLKTVNSKGLTPTTVRKDPWPKMDQATNGAIIHNSRCDPIDQLM